MHFRCPSAGHHHASLRVKVPGLSIISVSTLSHESVQIVKGTDGRLCDPVVRHHDRLCVCNRPTYVLMDSRTPFDHVVATPPLGGPIIRLIMKIGVSGQGSFM